MAQLQEEFSAKMLAAHFALNTEQAYWNWIRRYIFFHGKQHPKDLGAPEISMFPHVLNRGGKGVTSPLDV